MTVSVSTIAERTLRRLNDVERRGRGVRGVTT
jgi:hypothetical protein